MEAFYYILVVPCASDRSKLILSIVNHTRTLYYLYTGSVLFHVECCVRDLSCSWTKLYNINII